MPVQTQSNITQTAQHSNYNGANIGPFFFGGDFVPLVKMLVSMVGPGESWVPGDEREVTEEVAEAWKNAGIAELVEAAPKKKAAK